MAVCSGGGKIERDVIVGAIDGAAGLLLPVPRRKFAAKEREHHGNFSHHVTPSTLRRTESELPVLPKLGV